MTRLFNVTPMLYDTGTRNIGLDSLFVCLFVFSTLIVGIDVDQSKVPFVNITSFTGQQGENFRNVVCMCARPACILVSSNNGTEQTMCFPECIFTDHVSWIKCC